MKYVLLVVIVLIVGLMIPHTYTRWRTNQEITEKTNTSVAQLKAAGTEFKNRPGHVEVRGVVRNLTVTDLRRIIKDQNKKHDTMYIWKWGGVSNATATAMGIDRRHHFVNSYLVGYQPFETEHIWVPLYTLSMRKRYQFDRLQYSGLKEVWQNSKQAFYYTRGDCEDHAIILADWLISLGFDARVALGTLKNGGHAWVVCFVEGKAYLLEATSKRKIRHLGSIPSAAMMTDYHPTHQFNRESFWVNTGSRFTTKYKGPQWKMKSLFVSSKGGA